MDFNTIERIKVEAGCLVRDFFLTGNNYYSQRFGDLVLHAGRLTPTKELRSNHQRREWERTAHRTLSLYLPDKTVVMCKYDMKQRRAKIVTYKGLDGLDQSRLDLYMRELENVLRQERIKVENVKEINERVNML